MRDVWLPNQGWKWGLLTNKINANCKLRLAVVALTEEWDRSDSVRWLGTEKGEFSTKSAFNWILSQHHTSMGHNVTFEVIWNLVVPERVRFFMWLVCRERILTNSERARRHMAATDLCSSISSATATLLLPFGRSSSRVPVKLISLVLIGMTGSSLI